MRSLALLPWTTRIIALALWPLVLAGPTLLSHGTAPSTDPAPAEVMSAGWVLAAWIAASPFIAGEVAAAVRGRQRVSQVCAVGTAFVLAAVASLPVVLRLGPVGPTTHDWLLVAANTYVVLVLGSVVLSAGACLLPSVRRRAASLAR